MEVATVGASDDDGLATFAEELHLEDLGGHLTWGGRARWPAKVA